MTEGQGNRTEKKDWSRAESVLNTDKQETRLTAPNVRGPLQMGPREPAPPVIVPQPDLAASHGMIASVKANKVARTAALAQLEEQYRGQMDLLKETIAQAIKVHKTRISVAAEEYIRTLDSKHLELLTQLGMRNAETRWKAVTNLTDMAVAKVREVEEKDWPESLIRDTVAKIFALRERVAGEIMKELGVEFAAE